MRWTLFVENELQAGILRSLLATGRLTSRRKLSDELRLGRSTISSEVRRLLDSKVLEEAEFAVSEGGRRSSLLRVSREAGLIAAVDLGATSIDVALTTLTAERLAHNAVPWDIGVGPERTLERVGELLAGLLDETGASPNALAAAGIGVPGPVDQSAGQLVAPPIMPGWNRFSVKTAFENRYGCPAFVDNDVNIMALGEHSRGVGRGVDNLILVKIGTGIGSGMVINGSLYRGSDGCAGDIGHVAVDPRGPICTCGNAGCLEAMAAGPAIARAAEKAANEGRGLVLAELLAKKGALDPHDVGDAASRGDHEALNIIRESGRLVGQALASVVSLLNPSLIVIGGGASHIGNALLAEIRTAVYKRSLPLATHNLRVVPSQLDALAGVTGASVMAAQGVLASGASFQEVIAEVKRL